MQPKTRISTGGMLMEQQANVKDEIVVDVSNNITGWQSTTGG